MFRIWYKLIKDNHMLRDIVIEDDNDKTRTHKVFDSLTEACYKFDIQKPIWLDVTVSDFKRFSKARFMQDAFIETIDFDYLEMEVIEE